MIDEIQSLVEAVINEANDIGEQLRSVLDRLDALNEKAGQIKGDAESASIDKLKHYLTLAHESAATAENRIYIATDGAQDVSRRITA